MAKAGTLSVSILARTSSFTKGMKRVKRELGDVTRRAAAFGAVAVAAGAFMVRQQMQQIDTTGKLAARLRSSTEDIIALNKATKEAGGSAEGMQKMLQFLAKAAGEAAGGSLLTKRVFDGIGISMDNLKSKSPVELMVSVSEALDRISNVNTRAAVAARLFGRQGVQNLNTLTDLRSKLDEVRAHTEKTGLAFSNLDAAKVEAANDAWGRVKDVLTGIATQVAIKISPIILALSQQFVEAATAGDDMGNRVTSALDKITDKAVGTIEWINRIRLGFDVVRLAVLTVGEGINKLLSFIPGKDRGLFSSMAEDFSKEADEVRAGILKLSDDISNKTLGKTVDAFLGKARSNAEEIAKKMTETKKVAGEISTEGLDSLFGDGAKTKDNKPSLDLFQGDISRFALGFEGRMKKDKNPQIDKTNAILEKILGKVGGPNIAVAG